MDTYFNFEFRMKYLSKIVENYHKLDKNGKSLMLNQIKELLGCHEKYIIYLLNHLEKVKKCFKIKVRGAKPKYKCIKHILNIQFIYILE